MAQIIPVNGGGGNGGGGSGDMLKSVYDPNNVNANAFDYNNFINTPNIPTKTSDLNNDSGFITGVTSDDVTEALGYTPYNSTNPNGYVTNSIINDTAYGNSWDGDTTHSPTKNAVYDKINSMDTAIGSNTTAISTINGKIPSAATSSNQLADKDYVNDGINSVTAYYITKDAQGNQWATRAELFAATTFYSGGVVRVPTKNDYTIVLADENHDNATTRYIYNNSWEYQYTVNETAMTQAQLNAINSGITAAKVSTYDGYASTIAGKQDTLTPSTGINISSNTISNTLPFSGTNGGVKVFPYPTTSVEDIVTRCNAGGNAILMKSDGLYLVSSIGNTYIASVRDSSGDNAMFGTGSVNVDLLQFDPSTYDLVMSNFVHTYNYFNPGGTATTGYVVTKTANGYEWAAPSGGISLDANSPITVSKLRVGTEAQYSALGSYDASTVYMTV